MVHTCRSDIEINLRYCVSYLLQHQDGHRVLACLHLSDGIEVLGFRDYDNYDLPAHVGVMTLFCTCKQLLPHILE